VSAALPEGVRIVPLTPHADDRGVFTEIFRDEWDAGISPVQWNAVVSEAGVLRGVHAHHRHDDYLTLPVGRATIGLCDLRPGSPTDGLATCVTLSAGEPSGIVIPTGVAHGFLFHERSLHVYAVSHTWDVADELGCRWDDPELGIPWPHAPALISGRDAALGDLAALRRDLEDAATDQIAT
jgi:dTDP-4-dehydrorhamnose 3,5-epimerase